MAKIFLGIGSNIEPARHLRLAITELERRFGSVERSPVYRNAAVGFDGEEFLNMAVAVRSGLSPQAVVAQLEEIHDLAGRSRGGAGPDARTLDIDLLLYDDRISGGSDGIELPRRDVLEYDFVLRPLAELAPAFVHPQTGRSLAEHWRQQVAAGPGRPMSRERIEFPARLA